MSDLPNKLRDYADYRATPDDLSRCLFSAADEIDRLRAVLQSIADSQGGYGKWPVESRCTVAIAYEDRARMAVDPEYAKEQADVMADVFKRIWGKK